MRAGDLHELPQASVRRAMPSFAAVRAEYPIASSTGSEAALPPSPGEPVLTPRPSCLRHPADRIPARAWGPRETISPSNVIESYEKLSTLRIRPRRRRRASLSAAPRGPGSGTSTTASSTCGAVRASRALSGAWSGPGVEEEYLQARPSLVVAVDDFLSPEAIENLRLFCLESTVWSINRYDHGRLGSFFRDGFNCPLLIQIAEELRTALPRLIGARHPLTQMWGYKYAPSQPSLSPHADFAAVNVNLWITPDDANLDPSSGGLVTCTT